MDHPVPPPPRSLRPALVLFVFLSGLVIVLVWLGRKTEGFGLRGKTSALSQRGDAVREAAVARWGSYEAARTEAEARRMALAARWKAAPAEKREPILEEAAAALADTVGRHLAPFWMGTPWDFNGTSQTPQEGKVACGYFVAVMMKHAGFSVERVKLAQQASQNIILTFTGGPHLSRGHGMKLEDFCTLMKASGPGLHIVGLDNHVGLLWNDGAELWFLHSTVAAPGQVVMERAGESGVLGRSRYRIAGTLTADLKLMEAWLEGRALPVYQPPPKRSTPPVTRQP